MKDKSLDTETYTVSVGVNVNSSELDKTEAQLERINELIQINANAIIENATMTVASIREQDERFSKVIREIVQDEIHKWAMRESQIGGRLSKW
ncbi:hypothetical protein LGZ99_20340 [Photorhabdus temperata]|uniref:hypothetical protein n=1 Tax=Photorhabdus temperata TaxID=574560 RepID=UPI00038A033B|nr:hypothetical protein [Photorhabdus temperata]EQB97804.1 hypothetical protein B738_28772 [Photorhabdus temperata subsp. temperata M1021]MCT8349478.1 hypothetical protein [Photorhabdus temperata]